MSLRPLCWPAPYRLRALEAWLLRRWVQTAIFVGSLLLFWILAGGVAHA